MKTDTECYSHCGADVNDVFLTSCLCLVGYNEKICECAELALNKNSAVLSSVEGIGTNLNTSDWKCYTLHLVVF